MKQARKRPSTYSMVTAERLKVFMLIPDGFRWRWSLVLLCSKRIWQQKNYQNHIKDNDHHSYERNKTILNSNSWPLRWLCSGIGCRGVMDDGGGWVEELTLRSFYYTALPRGPYPSPFIYHFIPPSGMSCPATRHFGIIELSEFYSNYGVHSINYDCYYLVSKNATSALTYRHVRFVKTNMTLLNLHDRKCFNTLFFLWNHFNAVSVLY